MNAGELHKLARTLRDIAAASTTEPGERTVSPGLLAVVEDVAANPDTTIGEIAKRTDFAQSLVSTTVATLRERHVLDVSTDPHDRRRTVVRVNAEAHKQLIYPRAERSITAAVHAALGDVRDSEVRRIERLLDDLVDVLVN